MCIDLALELTGDSGTAGVFVNSVCVREREVHHVNKIDTYTQAGAEPREDSQACSSVVCRLRLELPDPGLHGGHRRLFRGMMAHIVCVCVDGYFML